MRTAVVLCVTLGLALTALLVTGAFRPSPSSSIAGTETSRTGETAKLPNGTLVVGKRAGKRAAGLYVTPNGRSEVSVRTILIGPDGLGADGLTVSFSQPDGGEVPGEPCGVGCYRAARPLSAGVPIVVLVGEGGTQTSVRFDVPATWEPAAIVAKRLTLGLSEPRERRLRRAARDGARARDQHPLGDGGTESALVRHPSRQTRDRRGQPPLGQGARRPLGQERDHPTAGA